MPVLFQISDVFILLYPQRNYAIVNLANRFGEPVSVVTKGRHDPCVAIRGVPVAEAMVAIVLADHLLQARAEGVPLTPRPWDQRED